MVCLIKSKNKPLLDSYADILGSEDAAYYVLSLNNGYSLEFTPEGEKSDLFLLLLAKNNYDYEAAIQEKAEMYYSSFYKEIGGDWTISSLDSSVVDKKGEPKIDYKPGIIDFSDIIDQPIKLTEMDLMNLSELLANMILEDLDNYLNRSSVNTPYEVHQRKTEWLKEKQKKLVDSINEDLLSAFRLEKRVDKNGNVTFVSKDKTQDGKHQVIILFCEYIEDRKRGVYDLTGKIEAAANLILISLLDADPTTFNHELAHHYVRMFWNSELIQNVAKKLDTGDRSTGWQVRLEERIVDEITSRTTDVSGFWNKLGDIIKTAFRWISSPVKQSLLRKASIAFRINDLALAIKREQAVLLFIDPTAKRVFLNSPNTYTFNFDDVFLHNGIIDAINLFILDSNAFFTSYHTNPNSMVKDLYDEYFLHVVKTLSGLNISEADFNAVSIIIYNNEHSSRSLDDSDPIKLSALRLVECIALASAIRETVRLLLNTGGLQPGTEGSMREEDAFRSVMEKIIAGLNTRIYEYLHTVPKEAKKANDTRQFVEKILLIHEYKDQLKLFLVDGCLELRQIYLDIVSHDRTNYTQMDAQQIQSLYNTVNGFYKPVIDIIYKELIRENALFQNPILDTVEVMIGDMQRLCSVIDGYISKANTVVSKRVTHEFLLGNLEEGSVGALDGLLTDTQKERWLNNFDDLLIIGKLFEDINMAQPYIGLASRSRSLVIRTARNMILAANAEIRKATLKDTAKIIKLYVQALPEMKKLGLKELQSVFQEVDDNGKKTGYFVRALNFGKFYKLLDDKRDELIQVANEKLKLAFGDNAPQITYDYYNNPILPPSDDVVVNLILQQYADDLDEWQCENAERMFTPEYYRKRRQMLSPITRQTMSNVQDRINSIMSKCPVIETVDSSGKKSFIQATWQLSPEDQQNLMLLLTEYQQLGNLYYSDGTKKTGEQLRIAQEITAFNEWKSQHISYDQNKERFDKAIDEIRKVYGLNSVEESRFRKLNTRVTVNPDYYDFVMSKVNFSNDPELEKLRKKRNDLKKLIDEFDKKGIDIEQKRRLLLYWDELKEVDKAIKELLLQIGFSEEDEEHRWSTYFDVEKVMYDENTSLLDHMLQQDILEYRANHPGDTRTDTELRSELIRKYQYVYTWRDIHGELHEGVSLVSVFIRNIPRGASVNNNVLDASYTIRGRHHRFPGALHVLYSNQFSDVNPESEFYNINYDRQSGVFVLPKHDIYQNSKQWDLIKNNENILKLYNALIDLLRKNNARIPNTNNDSCYKLPLVTGRRLTILRRCSSLKEIGDALKYNWQNEWLMNERDDSDVNYDDVKIKIRQDGSRINNVPVRFVKPLDDPNKITSDVIGSVIAFTESSYNFVVKTLLSSELELMKRQLEDRLNTGLAEARGQQSTANTIKQLTNMMDDLIYGNNTKMFDKYNNFTKKQQMFIKFMDNMRRFGRELMLGFNISSMTLGFIESAIRGFLEAALGKDYTMSDFTKAYHKTWKHFISVVRQVGSFEVTDLMIAQMLWFGVSKSIKESYHSTERNRFIKVLHENLNGMFGFSMGDYFNSSVLLSMALSNVRFIENNPYVNDGFYTKHTLIKTILNNNPGLSYKDAKNLALAAYKESGKSLEDAYELSEGVLQVKPEYQPYINNVIENRVSGKCYQRLAEALGVVPQGDTPGYALWVLLKPLGVIRTFMFTMIARNWNWAHDLQLRYIDGGGKINKINDMIDGYVDIDAGNMNISVHQGLHGWMKELLFNLNIIKRKADSIPATDESKELYNYAAKKVGLEILSIVVMVGISTLFKAMARGAQDDEWWVRFGYLISVRLVNSFITYLDPTALLEMIKNISTLISPLNDLINSITTLSDILGLSGHSPFEEIKSGSYKGRSRLFRNLMRITPFGNAYEDLSNSALKSRTNWYLQQDALIWSSIGGAYDQLWGTSSTGLR